MVSSVDPGWERSGFSVVLHGGDGDTIPFQIEARGYFFSTK